MLITECLLQRRYRRLGMLVRLDAVQNRRNLSLRTDHKRGPVNTHVFFAIHALFFHHAVGVADGLVHVSQQGIRQLVLLFELLLGRGFIGGDAEYHSPGFLDFLECVAEPARLYGSTWCIGLGIEEQNHVFAPIIL